MKRSLLVAAAALLMATTAARAANLDDVLQAANNLAHEHLICAVYANIVAACMIQKNENDPTGPRYKELTQTFMERGFRIGDAAGVSFKASKARFEMAGQEMMREIESNCSNISILLQQHLNACVSLHDEGPSRFGAIVNGGRGQ
jgi:hypothetical protein